MKGRTRGSVGRAGITLALLAMVGVLSACSLLAPSRTPEIRLFTLDDDILPAGTPRGALTVTVVPLRSAAGFDSPRMAYVLAEHQLAYFTQSAWVESPADMLAPLLVRAVVRNGVFRASVSPGSTARSDVQLESELLLLQQEFDQHPSRVRLAVRVSLVANAGRRILATRVFQSVADADSEDAAGGVAAANLAARQLVTDIADWSGMVAVAEHSKHPGNETGH